VLDWIADPNAWIALVTLTALEIVLGVDNIVFISILSSKLPKHQQGRGRITGLGMALFGRVALLLSLSWIMGLVEPLFTVLGREFSWRDLILVAGGLFLLVKATAEIHEAIEGEVHEHVNGASVSFAAVIAQIAALDLVFSLDSVITAVGMANDIPVMILAVVIAILFMMWSAGRVAAFIEQHPTVKMLALSFLLLVGVALIADGFGVHIPRGYVYFAMAFSVFVEVLNLKVRLRPGRPRSGV
jgi:predicted tellurium resistance membrane protein TerC